MRNLVCMRKTALGITLASLFGTGVSQPVDQLDMRCLTREQQGQLLARVDELNSKFKIQDGIDRAMELLKEQEQRGPIAIECKRRLETLTQVLGATLSGCPQKIDQYNLTVASLESQMSQLTVLQNIIKNQLSLERSKWPACR